MKLSPGQTSAFVFLVCYCGAVLILIYRARKGMKLPEIYKIPGLDAIDEAVGRCTEMGTSVHFSPGIAGLDDAQTLAGLAILGYVARRCAKYDTDLVCTIRTIIVFPLAEETVKQAFIQEGKADRFKPEMVRFISNDQFAYASGVTEIMYREKPGANILIGGFWAESLLIAEIGSIVGAIQIAGTARLQQIPFFVAACDYALIGEEIYAATAYLTREPITMGTLVAEDWGKMLAEVVIIVGCILQSFGITVLKDLLSK